MTESELSKDDRPGYRLVHPVYLDVQMMISFLAHLEGGVATHEEETTKSSGARERALKARAGLRTILPWPVAAEAQAEGSLGTRKEDSTELKSERHHTAASLFNLLYEYLNEDGQFVELDSPESLVTLHSGQLVEIEGEYLGNPLEDVLALATSFFPYIEEQQAAQKVAAEKAADAARRAQRSGNPQKRNQAAAQSGEQQAVAALEGFAQQVTDANREFGMRVMRRMGEDLTKVPVHDLLLRTRQGLKVVLTVSADYYSVATNEYLRAGEFRVVGKVTRVIDGEKTINLTRRTVLGASGSTTAKDILGSLDKAEGLDVDVADPIVTAPAVQVLPMAIYI